MRRCDAYRKRRGKEASKEEEKKYEDVEGRRKDTDKRKRGVGGELVEPEVEVRVGPEREKREPEANQRRR